MTFDGQILYNLLQAPDTYRNICVHFYFLSLIKTNAVSLDMDWAGSQEEKKAGRFLTNWRDEAQHREKEYGQASAKEWDSKG